MGERRSVVGFEFMDRGASVVGFELTVARGASVVGFELTAARGDRSIESRGLCTGEGESASDLVTPLLNLLTLGVAGDGLLLGVSDKVDLDLEDMVFE